MNEMVMILREGKMGSMMMVIKPIIVAIYLCAEQMWHSHCPIYSPQ